MGTPEKSYIVETKGSGVGLIDYDNDGWLDIYVVNGSTVDALTGKETPPHAALFRNNHDGTFTDVAAKAGVTNDRWGTGVAIADYDNDGWPDIFVSNVGKNRLYHNNHDGTFTDVAEKAGVRWATGRAAPPGATTTATGGWTCLWPAIFTGTGTTCPAARRAGSQCLLHLPRRGGSLRAEGPEGRAGSPVPQQRRRDLYRREREGRRGRQAGLLRPGRAVCGHQQRRQDRSAGGQRLDAQLSLSEQGRRDFEDVSYASGFALNEAGRETASMGIAVGDYQNNGQLASSTPPSPTITSPSTATRATAT
jgi:hypothetical protein